MSGECLVPNRRRPSCQITARFVLGSDNLILHFMQVISLRVSILTHVRLGRIMSWLAGVDLEFRKINFIQIACPLVDTSGYLI